MMKGSKVKYITQATHLFVVFFLVACQSTPDKISEKELTKLNGYWEIEKVTLPDGSIKQYNVNTSIDYIQLDGFKGFRKKMQPKLNGTYQTSDDAENFELQKEKEHFVFYYRNNLSEWSEKLLKVSAQHFSVENGEGIRYDYKKFEPISIPQ